MAVWKDGRAVYEKYWNGCTAAQPVHVFSVTKSIVSILVGIAIDKGYMESVDQKVLEFFPDYRIKRGEKTIQTVTIKNLHAALELDFGSADGYTRAFCREFGCTPREYANSPVPLLLFIPYGVKFKNLWKGEHEVEKVKNVFIQTVEKPCRKAVIKRGQKAGDYFEYCEEVGGYHYDYNTKSIQSSSAPVSLLVACATGFIDFS